MKSIRERPLEYWEGESGESSPSDMLSMLLNRSRSTKAHANAAANRTLLPVAVRERIRCTTRLPADTSGKKTLRKFAAEKGKSSAL